MRGVYRVKAKTFTKAEDIPFAIITLKTMATPSPTLLSPPSDSSPTSRQKNPRHSTSSQSQNALVALTASTSSAVARKTQPVLWTQDETLLLIESHKDKSRSINYIVRRPGTGVAGGLLQWGQKERSKTKRKDGEEEERSERCNF